MNSRGKTMEKIISKAGFRPEALEIFPPGRTFSTLIGQTGFIVAKAIAMGATWMTKDPKIPGYCRIRSAW
jgi:hypothetical protein